MNELPDSDAIKMFVGQLPKAWTENEVRAHFEEFGRIYLVNVLRDKVTKLSRGCCFIIFYTRKSALEAQNACHNIRVLAGMNHPIQMKPADNENRHERKIFVGMLTKSLGESDLRLLFIRFGLVEEISVLRDANGVSRGCGFVTFASKTSAINAIKNMHHSTIMEGCSSPLVVKIADTQKMDKNSKSTSSAAQAVCQDKGACSCVGNPGSSLFNPTAQQYYLTLLQVLQHQQESVNADSSLRVRQASHQTQQFGNASLLSALSAVNLMTSGCLATENSPVTCNPSLLGRPTAQSLGRFTNSAADEKEILAAMNLSVQNFPFPFSTFTGTGTGATSAAAAALSHAVPQLPHNLQPEGPEGSNLFIYHLPSDFSDADLIQCFSPYGAVVSAKVFIDKKTNLSKCFGFVSYDNSMSAQLAINGLNGYQVGSKRLKVQLKRPKEKPY